MKKSLVYILIVCYTLLVLATACTSDTPETETVYTVISEGTLNSGDAIPAPTGDVILTVTGNIGTTNVDDTIQMDLATIESVGLVEYMVDDPFDNRSITYQGVLMSDLLNLWQVGDDATVLHIVALNDYAVDVPIADLRTYPVIFAVKADGEYMPVSTRGPAMLVYPYNDFEFDVALYNDFWAWQIATIEVR